MNKNQVKKFPIKSSILISGWLGQRYSQSKNIFTFQAGWGYRKENCRIGKIDVAASMLQSCSFLKPNTTSRCTPSKSAALASVLKSGGTELNRDLREKYKEECLSNCQFLRWKHLLKFFVSYDSYSVLHFFCYIYILPQVLSVAKPVQPLRLSEARSKGLPHI